MLNDDEPSYLRNNQKKKIHRYLVTRKYMLT